jgi:hypothetical protein
LTSFLFLFISLSLRLPTTSLTSLPQLSGTSLQNLLVNNSTQITSIPDLPNTLTLLSAGGCTVLSSLPTLPQTLTLFDISDCAFTQESLDNAVTDFLLGTLPKSSWDSSNQTTGDQPSSGNQTLLSNTANVLNAAIFVALNVGYKKLYLYGADHSWLKDLFVDQDNNICSYQNHFYDDNKIPYKMAKGSLKLGIQGIIDAFESYEILENYSKSINATIINKTQGSYIDIFKYE